MSSLQALRMYLHEWDLRGVAATEFIESLWGKTQEGQEDITRVLSRRPHEEEQ